MTELSLIFQYFVPALSCQHGSAEGLPHRVGLFKCAGEDGLIEQFGGVGVYEIRTSFSEHHAERVGVGLHLGDHLCEPRQTDIDREGAYAVALGVVDGAAVGRKDVLHDDTFCRIFHKRFNPVGTVEQFRYQIPVHAVVLVVVGALLFCQDTVTIVISVSREVTAFLFIVERIEGDTAASKFWVVYKNLSAD